LRLKIDEYGPWVTGELDKVLRPTRSKAAKLVDEAARSLDEARSFYEGLARKGERDMATKKDAASYRAARVISHAAQQAEASLKDIQTPSDVTWESLKVLKDGLSGASRSIRGFRDSATRELSGFYLLDQRSFGGTLDRISKSGERLSAFLEGEGSQLQRSKTMTGIVESISTARRDLSEKLRESDTLTRELEEARASTKGLSVKVEELSSKSDLKEILEIEKELRKESRAFRGETLAHLQRPMRRLGDLAQRGDFAILSDERDALSKFIQSPYKSFLSKSTGQYVAGIIGDLKKAIDAGKMELKPRKAARISAQLNQLIGTTHLAEKQEKGRRLVARRRELLQNPECKDTYQHRKQLLLKIEEAKAHEKNLEERSRSLTSMSQALNKRLIELLKLAETKSREYVGKEVELERPEPTQLVAANN
jgi:hypothetical protein